ncbi:MAG TPA: hypothetical protein PK289_08055 [Bacteroidia bacterium]|nr:hypothetical protein [Bacteroidia bacterium]HRG52274.1 hypothetical protein [Bacteroidia bacterium]
MKKSLFFLLSLAVLGCGNPDKPKTEGQHVSDTTVQDTLLTPPVGTSEKSIINEGGSDCTRGTPEAIIKKNAFPKMSFELSQDKKQGIETVDFENGDKLIIKNWGCEYYALTFRFETSRFQSELTDVGFWYKRTVTMLNEINKKTDAPIDIVKGTDRLMNRIEEEVPNGYQNLEFGEELNFEEGEIRSSVRIDKVEKLNDKKFAIEVTFATGPL